MKLKTLNKSLAISLFAITSGFAVQASAASFTFTQYGGFVPNPGIPQANYTGEVMGAADVIPGTTVYSTMSWNNSSPTQSSLVLSTVTTPTALAENVWTTISTLTHNNIIIPQGTNWSGQDILGRLVITDNDGVPTVVEDDESTITIDFSETPNTGTCPLGNPNFTVCDDLFSFTSLGLAQLDFQDNDGNQWIAEFQLANLDNAVFDPETFTVWTGEEEISSLDVQMRLTMQPTTPVPEPATLSILGLGLLGLGLARRRKFSA